jgi:cadmium resistance protein CadD (predicted permease)
MCNVGGIDRALRIIVGLALLSLVFIGDKVPFIGENVIWGWVGIVPLVTGVFRFCPAYALFGIKTCKTS